MNFLRSYFFKNEPLISCPFLSSKLDSPVIKTLGEWVDALIWRFFFSFFLGKRISESCSSTAWSSTYGYGLVGQFDWLWGTSAVGIESPPAIAKQCTSSSHFFTNRNRFFKKKPIVFPLKITVAHCNYWMEADLLCIWPLHNSHSDMLFRGFLTKIWWILSRIKIWGRPWPLRPLGVIFQA